MDLSSLFEICCPRPDVLEGRIAESDFAADLARVLRGDAPVEYQQPEKFFANTHPTRGLVELLNSVCQRLKGSNQQMGAIFRLDTNYGGGKTHALIALIHVVEGMKGVENISEFINPSLIPTSKARIAAFDGENSDPVNGHLVGNGIRAKTPWGELAYALAGVDGYELLRASDEQGIAPGADTIRELFGNDPTLILLDELSIYLRKLKAKDRDRAGGQLTAFLTALFKAVESSPNAALVYTLAIGKSGLATDAYADENQFIASAMDELMSVSARKATMLDPTEEDETVKVLRRRLFSHIDDVRAKEVINAYQQIWDQQGDSIHQDKDIGIRTEAFQNGFPLHPELIETLRDKTATLNNFQRVRGMLRLLARTVAQLWNEQPSSTYAIHLHHLDPGNESIRREILTKLGLSQFLPAIRADVAGVEGDQPSLAQGLDAQHYSGLTSYASFVARIILFHSLAFNEALKGLTAEQLRYSLIAPGLDISFADDAVRRFVQESAYLDDRPNAPLRFLAEANLTQLIRRQESHIDPGKIRDELNDEIKELFKLGKNFELIPFPGGPYDVPDDTGEGKPYLVLIGYEAESVNGVQVEVPDLVKRLFQEKGSSGDVRLNRNNLVFLCVDVDRKDDMRLKIRRHIAIRELLNSPAFAQLADYQQDALKEEKGKSKTQAAIAAQQAYRHLFYPSRNRLDGADVDLTHSVIDTPSASESPGAGQKQVVRLLQDSRKLRLPEDSQDSPSYVRDKTPLRKGQISTASLRLEFCRDPALPILVGDQVFIKGIVEGINEGLYVYQNGDLLWGKGDPAAVIKVEENAYVLTTDYANDNNIWPPPLRLTPNVTYHPNESESFGPTGGQSPVPSDGNVSTATYESEGGNSPSGQPHIKGFTAEGPLKEALTKVWEQVQVAKVSHLASLEIKIFDASDAFTLMGFVRQVSNAEVRVEFAGEYATAAGSTMMVEFNGSVNDALVVKEFLAAQMRAAAEKSLEATYIIKFSEGLDMTGEDPEKLTERLSRMGAGAAHVTATAEGI